MTRRNKNLRRVRPPHAAHANSQRGEAAEAAAADAVPMAWHKWLPFAVVAAGLIVYANSFSNAFLYEDHSLIVENERIHDLGDLGRVMSGRRPVTDLTLAINYALGGLNVGGYHAVNLAIHILAGLTLFGLVRRLLLTDRLRGTFGRASLWLALGVALIWVVHPLQTQSVTYISQRAEALTGLFYVLTLYALLRGATSSRGGGVWYVVAVVACALGMGSRAVMVTAPIMALAFDRVFLSSSFGQVLRQRGALHLGLMLTWGVLLLTGAAQGARGSPTASDATSLALQPVTPWEYLLTQPGAILHYIRLALWPETLCLDYDWQPVRSLNEALLPTIVVLLMVLGMAWSLSRQRPGAFLGLWFFLILLPTSSVIPFRDPVAEQRMYLPLAAMVALIVLVGYGLLVDFFGMSARGARVRQVISAVLMAAVVLALGMRTIQRNRDYRDPQTMWQDVVSTRPHNARAHVALGGAHFANGQLDQATAAFRQALAIRPAFADAWYHLGHSLFTAGDYEGAISSFLAAQQHGRRDALTYYNLGAAHRWLDLPEEAIGFYHEALRRDPDLPEANLSLGRALMDDEDYDQAIYYLQRAASLRPDDGEVHLDLGAALNAAGLPDKARIAYETAERLDPDNAAIREALENVSAEIQPTAPDADAPETAASETDAP